MPSQLHESHLLLFRNQPALAAELMRGALGVNLPRYREARVVSADLTDIQPAEYRADMVVQLFDDVSVFGIVVEVQLSVDERKRFVWPAYVSNLRARLGCPVCLLVVTAGDAVARWAAKCVEMGGLHQFAPYVLGPSGVPEIADEAEALRNPELAVLSAMAHGKDDNVERSNSLSEAARQALGAMDIRKYEYQSDFARRYVAQGEAAGRVAIVAQLLTARFGPLNAEVQGKLSEASIADLHAMAERLLVAGSLREALGTS